MINFSVVFGLLISLIVLFLLSVLVVVVKDLVCHKYGEDVGLTILIAVMSVLLIWLSSMSGR